jgi:hypothetical protein
MSDRHKDNLTPDEERTREAVRSMSTAEADPAFKQRLKTAFVTGQIGKEADRGRQTRAPSRRRLRGRLWVPVAFAAVVVLVLVLNMGPSLEVVDVTGVGTVTVDGRVFETTDREGLARTIQPGSRIELSEGVEIDVM